MSIKKATVIRAVIGVCVVAAVSVGGFLITRTLARFERNEYFKVRELQVAAAAAGIDYRDVEVLEGEKSDEGTPAFERIKEQLIRIRDSDSSISFVYLMAPRGDEMIFLVDAEDPGSSEYSPPGQVYEEAKPDNFDVFNGRKAPLPEVEEDVTDRWGIWISASAYILDEKAEPIALLGTDVDMEEALSAYNRITLFGILYTILVAILTALIFLQWILYKYFRDNHQEQKQQPEKPEEGKPEQSG